MEICFTINMNKIRLKKNIFIQKLKQNFVILNEENGKYFLVNDTSIQIIDILKEMTDINEIIDSYEDIQLMRLQRRTM